jgi:hypothetical protein
MFNHGGGGGRGGSQKYAHVRAYSDSDSSSDDDDGGGNPHDDFIQREIRQQKVRYDIIVCRVWMMTRGDDLPRLGKRWAAC